MYLCQVRKFIVVSLLLSFFVVFTPRFFWHSHDHDEEITLLNVKQSNSSHFDAGDCFVCDFNLSLFTVHDTYSFFKHNNAVIPKPLNSILAIFSEFWGYSALRGPPFMN